MIGSFLLGGLPALTGQTFSALRSLAVAVGRLPAVGDGMLGLLRSVDQRLADMHDTLASLGELDAIREGIATLDTRLQSLGVLADLPKILAAVEPLGTRLQELDQGVGRLERELLKVSGAVEPLDDDFKQIGRDTGQLRRDLAAVRLRVDGIADHGMVHLVTGVDQLVERVDAMHHAVEDLKTSVEDVTEHLPVGGPGLVSRARDAITAIGDHSG